MIKMIKFKSKLYQLILIIIIVISVSAVVVVVGCCCGCVGTAFLTVPSPCFASYIFCVCFLNILQLYLHTLPYTHPARALACTHFSNRLHPFKHPYTIYMRCCCDFLFCFVCFAAALIFSSLISLCVFVCPAFYFLLILFVFLLVCFCLLLFFRLIKDNSVIITVFSITVRHFLRAQFAKCTHQFFSR